MQLQWLTDFLNAIGAELGRVLPGTIYTYGVNIQTLIAIVLVSLACGSVGSLVVGNRMAFFSDALAHCAIAALGIALLFSTFSAAVGSEHEWLAIWLTPILVVFGIMVGLGIALVREKTSQASDTVIGVFFAGAIGLGAILIQAASERSRTIDPENLLFGHPATMAPIHLIELLLLTVVMGVVLCFLYNGLVFASFNPSLAQSRGIRVRLLKYAFIIALALIVNICLKTVGALLINALLIVPAATAANLCKNMRQLFPCAICLCLFCGIAGQNLSWEIEVQTAEAIKPGMTGTIVVLTVAFYFLSIPLGQYIKNRAAPTARAAENVLQS